jgi:hypothetical protein
LGQSERAEEERSGRMNGKREPCSVLCRLPQWTLLS